MSLQATSDSSTYAARAMVDIVYDHMERKTHHITLPSFTLSWRFGEQRLGDGCKDQVLTITDLEIYRGSRKLDIVRYFAAMIIRGRFPMPRQPISFLHFQEPREEYRMEWLKLHFNQYLIGGRMDYWHVVDGQGELL